MTTNINNNIAVTTRSHARERFFWWAVTVAVTSTLVFSGYCNPIFTNAWLLLPVTRNSNIRFPILKQQPGPLIYRRGIINCRLSALTKEDKESHDDKDEENDKVIEKKNQQKQTKVGYDLGLGKNRPFAAGSSDDLNVEAKVDDAAKNWLAYEPVNEISLTPLQQGEVAAAATESLNRTTSRRFGKTTRKRKMVAVNEESQLMRAALWHEDHYSGGSKESGVRTGKETANQDGPPRPAMMYPNIDLSIPDTVYNAEKNIDIVWDVLRWEAYQEALREPLLVSFLYSTILNHPSLESSLAFSLANRLSSPMMISTQLQSLILNVLESSPEFRKFLRADMLAVRDRDPACTCLPDVFLYFKGFHALQSHRVANYLWKQQGKTVLAHYLQSQVSQIFQIDIHPNATLKSGIMLDHGTGIVIGETATVGHNCSILHHVTLGGSGKKGVDRHPKVQDGVLLGAGATVLGNVKVGEGCQVGAGTLVISDIAPHSVAVGVPAKIIGSFKDVTEQPSVGMDQMIVDDNERIVFQFSGIGI